MWASNERLTKQVASMASNINLKLTFSLRYYSDGSALIEINTFGEWHALKHTTTSHRWPNQVCAERTLSSRPHDYYSFIIFKNKRWSQTNNILLAIFSFLFVPSPQTLECDKQKDSSLHFEPAICFFTIPPLNLIRGVPRVLEAIQFLFKWQMSASLLISMKKKNNIVELRHRDCLAVMLLLLLPHE